MSSFLDWGVVAETKKGGVYIAGKQAKPKQTELLAWLAEAVLLSQCETQMAFSKLCHHPILFPIALDAINASVIRCDPRLRVERQSLNEEFVFLDSTTS